MTAHPRLITGAASLLFNAMLAPIAGYSLGGVLWDQGENNAHYCSAREYNCLFATMVRAWRQLFPGTSLAGDRTVRATRNPPLKPFIAVVQQQCTTKLVSSGPT